MSKIYIQLVMNLLTYQYIHKKYTLLEPRVSFNYSFR